ncbi:FimV/HubP family polar landmark protein [Psychrobacter lutiphocae]|uniref:FimV/HubP family polar landmark protein n=1 Tax=Psychrobacter lutiphocae TaxID=540500 RepID=UPI000372B4F0|nr:FimV/HubP family polar landmark protein [Psychrobacter lutiphocae]
MSLKVIIALIFIALLVVLLFITFRNQSNKRLALTKDKKPNLPTDDTSAQRQTLYESSLQQEDEPENKNNNKNDETPSIAGIANAVNIADIKAKTAKQTKTQKVDNESAKSHIAKSQTAKPNKAKQKTPTEPVQPTLASSETTAELDTSNNTNTDTIDSDIEVEANTIARPTEAKTADINQVHTDAPLISEADIADILGDTVSNTPATNSNKTQISKQIQAQTQTQIPEQTQEQIQTKANTERQSAIPSQPPAAAVTINSGTQLAVQQQRQPKPDTPAIKIQNHDERQVTADKHQAEIKAKAQAKQDKKQAHAQEEQEKKEQAQQQQQTKALNVNTQNIDTKTQTVDTKADSTPEVTSATAPVVADTETAIESGAEMAKQAFAFVQDIDSAQLTLDLAQQYLEVGEYDSAKRLLQEVLSPKIAGIHASAEQKSTANDLLQRLY